MPTIPTMTLSTEVDATEIYDNGLFDPNTTPDSLEILNGGMDITNFDPSNRVIVPRMWQYGSFAMGFSSGFERQEATYARQLGGEEGDTGEKCIHASLSHRLFLPFAPSCLIFGYQAFFQQDATKWTIGGTPVNEAWKVRLRVNGTEHQVARTTLPPSRWSNSTPAVGTIDHGSGTLSGPADENRWRFSSKGITVTNATKGYNEFKVTLESSVTSPDKKLAKCKTIMGSFHVLALR